MNTNESVSDYHAAISGPFLHFMKIVVRSWIEINESRNEILNRL